MGWRRTLGCLGARTNPDGPDPGLFKSETEPPGQGSWPHPARWAGCRQLPRLGGIGEGNHSARTIGILPKTKSEHHIVLRSNIWESGPLGLGPPNDDK